MDLSIERISTNENKAWVILFNWESSLPQGASKSLWTSGDVTINGIRIHYYRTGGAKPPLVLVHGITDNGLCWTPVAQVLEMQYDVIMVDARGHGKSDAVDHDYHVVSLAKDLAGLIQELGLPQPSLLGHSMGAITILVLASIYPGLPKSIILEDPPTWWMSTSETPENGRYADVRTWMTSVKSKTREELITEQHLSSASWSESELGPWADAKLQFSANVANFLDKENAASVEWSVILPRITCPGLLITADPSLGSRVTDTAAAGLNKLIPQLKVVHIPGAGHNIRREQFDRYIEVLRTFLANNMI